MIKKEKDREKERDRERQRRERERERKREKENSSIRLSFVAKRSSMVFHSKMVLFVAKC